MTDPNERSNARTEVASMERIEAALAGLGAEHDPPPGWEGRVALHQIAPLVVHAVKFGGGYVAAAERAIARYD